MNKKKEEFEKFLSKKSTITVLVATLVSIIVAIGMFLTFG